MDLSPGSTQDIIWAWGSISSTYPHTTYTISAHGTAATDRDAGSVAIPVDLSN